MFGFIDAIWLIVLLVSVTALLVYIGSFIFFRMKMRYVKSMLEYTQKFSEEQQDG